jgi:DNA-binding transcriptional MerR regulator
MPYKETKVEKLFWHIGEVADMFGVNPSLIRFWEKEFDILKPKKNNKGNRLFTKQDVENLKVIYHMVKVQGLTLRGAQKKLMENKEATVDNVAVIDKLFSIRQELEDIKSQLGCENK